MTAIVNIALAVAGSALVAAPMQRPPLVRVDPRQEEMATAELLGGSSRCEVSFQLDDDGVPQFPRVPQFVRVQCVSQVDGARIRTDLIAQANSVIAGEAERATRRAIARWRYMPDHQDSDCVRLTFQYPTGLSTPAISEGSNNLACGNVDIDF
ncbi:hypothetical protein [Maricaulis salignorans]|uniref:hypothetical protein n=1 Tax=Maricaulis salignorans TaxID=144026 RepID=UPI003A901745